MKEYLVNKVKQNHVSESKNWWNQANVLSDISSPWSTNSTKKTYFRALWDEKKLYFQFLAEDLSILKKIDRLKSSEPKNNDRVELFFRTDDQMSPYYCFEMDPLAQVLKFRAFPNKNFEFEWDWDKEVSALDIKSEILDGSYKVEGSFDLAGLQEMDLLSNNTLEVGVFRADYSDDKLGNVTWLSWMNPDSDDPNFHIPSSFGRFILKP